MLIEATKKKNFCKIFRRLSAGIMNEKKLVGRRFRRSEKVRQLAPFISILWALKTQSWLCVILVAT